MPLSSSVSVYQTPQEDRNKRNPKTNVCEHIFVFIFTSSFLNCCNQAAIWYNCTLIANYWIMGLCVCVCVLVKVTLESTICSVSCLLRLPLNLEEKCVKWRPSEHLMAQLACLLCVCVCEKQQQLSPQTQRVFIRRQKLHNHHIAHIPLIHLCSFQRWRQAEVFTSETLHRSLQICGCAYSTHIKTCRDFNILLINKLHQNYLVW